MQTINCMQQYVMQQYYFKVFHLLIPLIRSSLSRLKHL